VYKGISVGVVIPARDEEEHLPNVLATIPPFVDKVVVIDDGSTDRTGKLIGDADLVSLSGEGVGSAIDNGHKHLLSCFDNDFISVVIAGDGQMHPDDMTAVLDPIAENKADYVKGERLDRAGKMPVHRQIGTFLLSILTTLACGQTIRDSQCGYTATSSRVLKSWDWENSWKGYGYPNWWLMHLSERGYRIEHVPVRAIYQGQKSGIKLQSFFPKVSIMLLLGLHQRVIRNTLNNPTLPLVMTWLTYILGWVYNPFMFLVTHLSDRVHVSQIRRG